MAELEKWVWLSLASGAGSQKSHRLLSHFGTANAVYSAGREEYIRILETRNPRSIAKLCEKSLDEAEKIVITCRKKGIRIITRESSEYPPQLLNISNPPCVLYARGAELDAGGVSIAIVGTRNATDAGKASAEKLGGELASYGATVVTGLAKGIDSSAARGALDAGGKVIAVFGCGVDICYPRENKSLLEKVIKNGTVISEYAPGVGPSRSTFPIRNRLISGISRGTVLIEAPEKSGALITASHALEQNRDVFVVPSGILDGAGAGSNRLLRDGAIPVMSGRDVLSEYEGVLGGSIDLERKVRVPEKTVEKKEESLPEGYLEKFSSDDRKIIATIGMSELRADDIARQCGMKMQKVLSLLTLLEIRGCVKQLPGGRFKVNIKK